MSKVLVITYPHRLDEDGVPISKVIIVKSTVQPPIRRGDSPLRGLVTRVNLLKTLKP